MPFWEREKPSPIDSYQNTLREELANVGIDSSRHGSREEFESVPSEKLGEYAVAHTRALQRSGIPFDPERVAFGPATLLAEKEGISNKEAMKRICSEMRKKGIKW